MNLMEMDNYLIKKSLANSDLNVAVVGLGKVGLPLALIFADRELNVTGVDINQKTVELLNKGILPHYEPKVPELLVKCIEKGKFKAVTDTIAAVKDSNLIIMVVPTLIKKNKEPDITAVEKASESIGKGLKKGSMVIIESTVPPGTTEGVVKDILERESGLRACEDFGLAFCPERVQSPQVVDDITKNYPKIIGGIDPKSTEIASALYSFINKKGVITVKNPKTAEMEKVVENTYRDINIAFANELALISGKLGIDVMEVIDVANSQPFCNILRPGAGVGGHCIPMDPYYLIDEAKKIGLDVQLLENSRKINDYMPQHVVELVEDGLKEINKNISNSKIALLGVSYKENTDDYRYSPSRDIINYLHEKNAYIKTYDPFVDDVSDLNVEHFNELRECVKDVDCIIIATAHNEFKEMDLDDIKSLTDENCLFVDGRCAFNPDHVMNAGFVYKGVGR
ncbi:MAG: nucleotide sugar dehydrogenase [Methanobacteriaceae archaeon]|nr:nucleotide sugar dehydrogenase [Methanobacteriaceae archaeon]